MNRVLETAEGKVGAGYEPIGAWCGCLPRMLEIIAALATVFILAVLAVSATEEVLPWME